MPDLLRLALASPVTTMWLLIMAASVGVAWLGATFEFNEHSRQLVADARMALDRADCSIDYSSRCAQMSQPKLSDQLRGVSPFTAMWRLFASDDLHASDFEIEFLTIRAQRRGLAIVRADVGALIHKLDDALTGRKPMAKVAMSLSADEEKAS